MEAIVIREGDNLSSVYVKDEGKEAVISKGICPVCSEVITFTQDIVNKSRGEELASSLYEMFLLNHEVCFNCRITFGAWLKEHREIATRLHLTYRDVGNKYLEKLGKEPIIGISQEEESIEEVETEEVSPSIQDKNEVANG